MMSDSNGALTRKQVRVVKLSTAVAALVAVALILAVGQLFILRAASRAQVSKLACYVVRYSPDTDPTAKAIRDAYGCPPARALPTVPAVHRPVEPSPAPVTGPAAIRPGTAANIRPSVPPRVSAAPLVSDGPIVQPAGPSASRESSPEPSASPSGLLGGLLCDLHRLPVCLR